MRARRLWLLLFAVYLVFVGGSAYYALIFPVRVLHHAVVTLALAGWLLGCIRRGQGLPKTPLNRPLYAAVGVWVVTAVFSIDPRMAFEHLWFPFTHLLFFFVLADLVQRGRQRQLMEIQFFLGALVVIITGLEVASWYFGIGIVPGTSVGWVDVISPDAWLPLELPRVNLAMNISTLLAGYVAPVVLVAATWALTAARRYRRVLWTLAGLLTIVLVLTASRGGYLSLATGLGLLAALRLAGRIPRWGLAGLLAAGIAGVALVVFLTSAGRTSGDLGRVDMLQSAVRMFAADPLTGVGPGLFGPQFRILRNPLIVQDKLASAHNLYLNTAAETGLLGVVVGGWLALVFARSYWRQRQAAEGGRQLRLDACFAALVGLGVHSLVDVFTITPVLLLVALLAAYVVVRPRNGFEVPPSDQRGTAFAALVLVLGYGVWLGWLDAAQSRYQASLRGGDSALAEAQAAANMDPHLRLYQLQVAYLSAQNAEPEPARLLYEAALALDPTWDVGWVNLAALAEAEGDIEAALDALMRARALNDRSTATLHWARLAEYIGSAPDEEIIAAYRRVMWLPQSIWWEMTPLRQAAVQQWLDDAPVDLQYRFLSAVDPATAEMLVPGLPETSAGWWVFGEASLLAGDTSAADAAFSRAISLSPLDGDLYASRARSRVAADPDGARRDLLLADLLGTQFEYTNAIRADLTDDAEVKRRLWAAALPPRVVRQEFAQVVYGRPAGFDVLPAMRGPGPGTPVLAPWYALAQSYAEAGDSAAAANVYRAILDYAPEESVARAALNHLQPER